MRWPPGWPIESCGLASLRAAIVADGRGLLREFNRAAFSRNFVLGLGLRDLDDVLAVAEEVGLEPETVMHRVAADDIKHQLIHVTEAAIAAGVVGVPTVLAASQSFWGDDRLESAAAAMCDDLA